MSRGRDRQAGAGLRWIAIFVARPARAKRPAKAAAAGDRLRPLRRTMAMARLIAGCSSFTPITDAEPRGNVSCGTTARPSPLSTRPISVDTWRTSMTGRGSGGSSASAWSMKSRLRDACETRASGYFASSSHRTERRLASGWPAGQASA